ncbi:MULTISPECIES: DUF805 domain-containing protein [Phenylobacterium]|uniref:Uncharacterized membrane protein YhaH (DUF805 family) n=1 Tax=Phenylobacterium koreense TaxID=266125 RepID=A0ABV2EKY6_9CAUL
MDWKTLFLTPEGRIGRRDFWIGFAIIFAAGVVAGVIPLLGPLIGFLLIYPQVCVHAKRLHDMGRTAWLMLIPGAVFLGAMIVATMMGGLAAMSGDFGAVHGAAMMATGLAFMLSFLVGLAFLLWIGLTASQPGENRFGPPARSLVGTGVSAEG